jgi:Lar family restriction alleviation protein
VAVSRAKRPERPAGEPAARKNPALVRAVLRLVEATQPARVDALYRAMETLGAGSDAVRDAIKQLLAEDRVYVALGRKLRIRERRAAWVSPRAALAAAKSKPRPCPFCGGEGLRKRVLRRGYANFRDDPDAYAHYVRCRSCAAQGGWGKSTGTAVMQWNMRGTSPGDRARLRAIEAAAGRAAAGVRHSLACERAPGTGCLCGLGALRAAVAGKGGA